MPAPPQIPVVHFPSPEFGDNLLVEMHNTAIAAYEELPYGTRHPDSNKWPNYRLVKQQPMEGDEKWVLRLWMADEVVPDTFNVEKQTFEQEDNSYPAYARSYVYRRTEYAPLTKGTALSGIIGIKITAGGSGYDATTTISLSGGGGSGATAAPIIYRGAVVGAYMTAEGSSYTSAPSVAFNGPAGSVGAAGTALRQSNTAVLTQEWTDRVEGQPEDGLYVKVMRVYETLPGARTVSYRTVSGGNLKKVGKRKVLLPDLPDDPGPTTVSESVQPISSVVGVHEVETWVDSAGADLTVAPWMKSRENIEPEGVEVITWMKIVPRETLAPPMGATAIVVSDSNGTLETTSLASTARRRIHTFPTGATNAGEWLGGGQGYVIHAELRDIEDSPNRVLIVQSCGIPASLYQFPEHTFQFPALFLITSGGTPITLINGRVPLNSTGGAVTYKSHRTRTVTACLIQRFSFNQYLANPLSPQFFLNAPGAASVFLNQIDANTIYADLSDTSANFEIEVDGSTVEIFPPSDVTGCYPTTRGALPDFYLLIARQRVWKGNIWVREYLVVAEDRDIVDDAEQGEFESGGSFECV